MPDKVNAFVISHVMRIVLPALCIAALASCSDDDAEAFPSMITEMADVETNDNGFMTHLTIDTGKRYTLTNPIKGYKPRVVYRAVAGYVVEGQVKATLYSLEAAWILRDSTAAPLHDPADAVAAWRAGRYINIRLANKTQGGSQYWGYAIDSVCGRNHHISIHHNQNGDPAAYTANVYASIPVDSIADAAAGDTITLSVHTGSAIKRWAFEY